MTQTLIAAPLFALILLSCFITPPDKATAALTQKADLPKVSFRLIETNGIKMHIAEQGQGPLVILCHGFPESWYSWRHQIPALAAAGYHVVAQRGYGKTARPEAIEDYNTLQLAGKHDVVVAGFGKGAYERLEENPPQLRKKVLIPGKGHWIRQESLAEVNRLMIEFLAVIQN